METQKPSRIKVNLYIEKLDFLSLVSLLLIVFERNYSIKKVFIVESSGLSFFLKKLWFISVLDIVQIINMVLDSQFDSLADVNEDGMVDVLDIILVVNVILEN